MYKMGFFGRGFNCFGPEGFFFASPWMMGISILVLVVVAVVIIKTLKNRSNNGNDEALELLKIKFVKGEISEEEYLKKKSVLK